MENTLENKVKFFAQYWGQIVLLDTDNSSKQQLYLIDNSTMHMVAQFCLQLISFDEFVSRYTKAMIHGKKHIKELIKTPCSYDFLRSEGYAVPYMDIPVETLVEWGWVKLWD